MTRFPLWLTLVPLVVGVAVWYAFWAGWRDGFREDLARVLPPGTAVETGGFPYRMEATTGALALSYARPDLQAQAAASGVVFNRQPWRRDLTIASMTAPALSLTLPDVAGFAASLRGPEGQASLKIEEGHVARLSIVVPRAELRFGLVGVPMRAAEAEVHFRETPAARDRADRGPTLPGQQQVVIEATGLRLGGGDPLDFEADARVTAARPIRSYATFADGGTVEVERLRLADATGEVLRMKATAVPGDGRRLRVAGTITTVCPFTVRALFTGEPMPSENRARAEVTLPVEGQAGGGLRLVEPAGGLQRLPTRNQEPPCPRLR